MVLNCTKKLRPPSSIQQFLVHLLWEHPAGISLEPSIQPPPEIYTIENGQTSQVLVNNKVIVSSIRFINIHFPRSSTLSRVSGKRVSERRLFGCTGRRSLGVWCADIRHEIIFMKCTQVIPSYPSYGKESRNSVLTAVKILRQGK